MKVLLKGHGPAAPNPWSRINPPVVQSRKARQSHLRMKFFSRAEGVLWIEWMFLLTLSSREEVAALSSLMWLEGKRNGVKRGHLLGQPQVCFSKEQARIATTRGGPNEPRGEIGKRRNSVYLCPSQCMQRGWAQPCLSRTIRASLCLFFQCHSTLLYPTADAWFTNPTPRKCESFGDLSTGFLGHWLPDQLLH